MSQPRRYARIAGLGSHLPGAPVSNKELAQRHNLQTDDEWIAARTGIRRRHLAAEGELAGDLALPAAKQALAAAGMEAAELDMIIFATTTPDRIYPSTACLLQARLGAAPCAAFDLQAVCSGFLYALATGEAFIAGGRARRVLVVGAEVYSHILDWQDRSTCVLFGDGAGAAVLVESDQPGLVRSVLRADGAHADQLTVHAHVCGGKVEGDAHTRMNGAAVYRFAVEKMCEAASEALAGERADWLVAHQANARIIDAARKRLQLTPEQTVLTVADHGNTSAASIPLALASAAANFKEGDNIVLAAVGGGFTWGASFLQWRGGGQ